MLAAQVGFRAAFLAEQVSLVWPPAGLTRYGLLWWTWWLGDGTGDLLVAPLLLTLSSWTRVGQQLMWNLLPNAAKSPPAGGATMLRVERSEATVLIAVSDTGIDATM